MAVTIVQKAVSTGDASLSTTTQTAVFGSSVQAGSLVAVYVCHEGASTTLTVTNAGIDTFTGRTRNDYSNGDIHGQWFHVLASAGGFTTVTGNFTAARPWRRMYAFEIRTDNGGSWVADTEKLSATNATGSSATSGTFSTTGTGDIVAMGGYKEYAGGTPSAWAIDGVSAGTNHVEHDAGTGWAVAGAVTTGAATVTGPADAYVLVATSYNADAAGGAATSFPPHDPHRAFAHLLVR